MTLRQYMKIKNLSYGQRATYLDVSHAKQIQRWCLPFGHKEKVIPRAEYMMRIIEYTRGQVLPNDFYIQSGLE